MSLSLRRKYDDRAARFAQLLVLWLFFASALFLWLGGFGGEHFFDIARYWVVSSVSGSIVLIEHGRHFQAGVLFDWAVKNWPNTFANVRFTLAYSLAAGFLFAAGIFWIFGRAKQQKNKHERVRGARILSAEQLKKEIK